jgi:aminomethyltransferase
MTRFGFGPAEFSILAGLMKRVIADGADVRSEVNDLRAGFTELRYCFSADEYREELERLRALI